MQLTEETIPADRMAVRNFRTMYKRRRLNNVIGMWTLDPIDGTKGFLRGEQYAVCLALIVDSQVQVGVIGCPNLLHDLNGNPEDKGVLFVAVKGQGAEQVRPSRAFFKTI